MRTLPTIQRLTIAITLALLCGITAVHAIEQDQPFLMESWTLAPGSVFEMLAVSDASDRQIAWSLTKGDGTFVQADRGPLFRERFVETGDFLLRGEISAADNTAIAQRTFAIHIVAGTPSLTTGTGTNAFVATDPPFDAGGIAVIKENLQTILVQANPGTMQPGIDVSSGIDANGDGDPTNDNDSRGTFFESDGSALRLWFTDGVTERTLTVRGNGPAGPQTQSIRLYAGSAPSTVPPEQNQTESLSGLENVRIENHGSGTYAFSIDSSALSLQNRVILLYWDFGDGRQSMLDRPEHTYAQNGQYTVNLQVRDLNTTEEILHVTGILPVNTILQPTQPSSAQSSSEAVSSAGASPVTTPSRFNLRSILTIVGGLLLAVLAGFAVVTMVGKVVQQRLDREPPKSASGKPAKKSPSPAGLPSLDQPAPLSITNDAAPPMSVIDVTPTTDTQERQESSAEESDTAQDATEIESSKLNELTFKEEEAPSWLKQGHEEAEKLGHTVLTALPESEQPKKESEVPAPSTEKRDRPLPPWLQPEAPAIVETTPPPAPVPPPVAIPEPEPAPVAEPVAVPSPPEPAPAPAPAPIEPPPAVTPPAPPVVSPAPATPASAPKPKAPTPPPSAPKSSAALTPPAPPAEEKQELSEAERERRRKKRARYRQNKKKREEVSEENETPQEPSSATKLEPEQNTPVKEPAKNAPVKKQEPPLVAAPETASSKKEEETDEPIAIIRADNISQNKKDQKKS